ncbi:MAG: DnaJ domain-containing protein [Methylobacter sp.]|nr:DnaJ domain-containing protein [Methylobacter sp.]MDP2097517.1 DnaJ domain-containing protein [Methylobacter sp.]MDP2429358.1 DnaJ domain-containing protein [Methylobacter sp.]MDP3053783.1 DnaJ domain-containing protein [Methylobacter sp.]MDP3362766.1 DnaJ domain-containing protein [Methylobacter sp.]
MKAAQKDFYKILGVIGSAELAVIKAAYKALIMIYHPDRYHGDKKEAVRKSKEINEAYAVLTDPDKRKKYDAQRLKQPEQKSEASEMELNKLLDEVKMALEESKAILDILNAPD